MPKGVTNQGEDKKLGDALDGELLVSVANREDPPADPGHAHAEGAGRRRGQGRNIVGDGPLAEMSITLVAGGDEGLHVSVGREFPGRYSFGLGVVAGEGIVVHRHPLASECWSARAKVPAVPPGWQAGGAVRENPARSDLD